MDLFMFVTMSDPLNRGPQHLLVIMLQHFPTSNELKHEQKRRLRYFFFFFTKNETLAFFACINMTVYEWQML